MLNLAFVMVLFGWLRMTTLACLLAPSSFHTFTNYLLLRPTDSNLRFEQKFGTLDVLVNIRMT
eukprot:5519481-Prorocentrum_lima.AAC.1